jgi:hypothetical protein
MSRRIRILLVPVVTITVIFVGSRIIGMFSNGPCSTLFPANIENNLGVSLAEAQNQLAPITPSSLGQMLRLVVVNAGRGVTERARSAVVFNLSNTFMGLASQHSPYPYEAHCDNIWMWELSAENGNISIVTVPQGDRDISWNPIAKMIFSPNGDYLLTVYGLYEARTGIKVLEFEHGEFVNFPDKTLLSYFMKEEGTWHLWDMETRREVTPSLDTNM